MSSNNVTAIINLKIDRRAFGIMRYHFILNDISFGIKDGLIKAHL